MGMTGVAKRTEEFVPPQMLPCWTSERLVSLRELHRSHLRAYKRFSQQPRSPAVGDPVSGGIVSYFISRPTSKRRMLWDVVSAAIIVYDVMSFPLDAFGYLSWHVA